jgi:hypothetical protein
MITLPDPIDVDFQVWFSAKTHVLALIHTGTSRLQAKVTEVSRRRAVA